MLPLSLLARPRMPPSHSLPSSRSLSLSLSGDKNAAVEIPLGCFGGAVEDQVPPASRARGAGPEGGVSRRGRRDHAFPDPERCDFGPTTAAVNFCFAHGGRARGVVRARGLEALGEGGGGRLGPGIAAAAPFAGLSRGRWVCVCGGGAVLRRRLRPVGPGEAGGGVGQRESVG